MEANLSAAPDLGPLPQERNEDRKWNDDPILQQRSANTDTNQTFFAKQGGGGRAGTFTKTTP